ncbi:MAG TPA: hypothetical protein VG710_13385, partial [Opitutus sp.]|nr:hypothetical protein [Opitutus sp.]
QSLHRQGLSLGNQESAWTALPRVVFEFAPLPASRDVTLTFDAAAELAPGPDHPAPSAQAADVYFNATQLGTVAVGPRTKVSVLIPAALWNSQARARLELRFPAAVRHDDLAESRVPWWTAWRIWAIDFHTVPVAH